MSAETFSAQQKGKAYNGRIRKNPNVLDQIKWGFESKAFEFVLLSYTGHFGILHLKSWVEVVSSVWHGVKRSVSHDWQEESDVRIYEVNSGANIDTCKMASAAKTFESAQNCLSEKRNGARTVENISGPEAVWKGDKERSINRASSGCTREEACGIKKNNIVIGGAES